MRSQNRLVPSVLSFAILFAFVLSRAANAQSPTGPPAYRNPQLPVEQRVADLLSQMTLEEKVAPTHALWQRKKLIIDGEGNFSPEKAKDVLKLAAPR